MYQNVDRLEEYSFKDIPNITKEWFRNNSNVLCPDHSNFENSSNKNKMKKSNRKVGFAKAYGDYTAGETNNWYVSSDGDSDQDY